MIERRYRKEYGLTIPPVKSRRSDTNNKSQIIWR
jgi:hypothetical protein